MQILNKSGVCTLEIFNARMEDSGKYSCSAVNDLGSEETHCKITVQKRVSKATIPSELDLTHSPSYVRLRKTPSSSSVNSLARSATTTDVGQQGLSGLRPSRPVSQLMPQFK